jgi:acetyl esterase/lipase
MRRCVCLVALLLPGVLAWPARGEEAKVKTGGNFKVRVVENVAYYEGEGADKERHALDLYLPEDAKDFPVFVFIHGGGWSKGSRKGFARAGRTFARNGIGCVALNYRLSPAVKHPEHVKDVARAFAWTHQNIAKYGGNPKLLFVSGHSAGGHLAALLATDETYLKAHKLGLKDIKGVVPVSGVFVVGGKNVFGDAESRKNASPQTHVKEGLPPMLILYADKEIAGLGKQAERFGAALAKSKCEAKVVMIAERDHGSIMRNIANEDDPATQLIFAFLAKHGGLKLSDRKAKEAKP